MGAFGGLELDEGGRYSYAMKSATPYRLLDFGQSTPEQRWAILKKEGPVVSYYEPAGRDFEAPNVVFGLAKRRLQQANFRVSVFAYHGKRCKVSGCTAPELLEAAHLRGRNWQDGHNLATDGIPLRVDSHRAYDRGQIELDNQHQLIAVSEELQDQYDQYRHA